MGRLHTMTAMEPSSCVNKKNLLPEFAEGKSLRLSTKRVIEKAITMKPRTNMTIVESLRRRLICSFGRIKRGMIMAVLGPINVSECGLESSATFGEDDDLRSASEMTSREMATLKAVLTRLMEIFFARTNSLAISVTIFRTILRFRNTIMNLPPE